jgi:hypothetical protein
MKLFSFGRPKTEPPSTTNVEELAVTNRETSREVVLGLIHLWAAVSKRADFETTAKANGIDVACPVPKEVLTLLEQLLPPYLEFAISTGIVAATDVLPEYCKVKGN